MKDLDKKFPMYDWKNNKGYPTPKHRKAIDQIGIKNIIEKAINCFLLKLKLNFETSYNYLNLNY